LEVRELFSEKLLLALPADHGSFADSRNGGETRAAQVSRTIDRSLRLGPLESRRCVAEATSARPRCD